MTEITISREVKAPQKEVLSLISNFERYPEFIPGCSKAIILEKNKQFLIGRLHLNIMGMNYSLTSKNFLRKNVIHINQISGPFKKFNAKWEIKDLDSSSCSILFSSIFEIPFFLKPIYSKSIAENLISKVIESFLDKINQK